MLTGYARISTQDQTYAGGLEAGSIGTQHGALHRLGR